MSLRESKLLKNFKNGDHWKPLWGSDIWYEATIKRKKKSTMGISWRNVFQAEGRTSVKSLRLEQAFHIQG